MLIKIYENNPNPKAIQQVVEVLKKGGLIIYPTDTIYGLGCDITNQKPLKKSISCGEWSLKKQTSRLSVMI